MSDDNANQIWDRDGVDYTTSEGGGKGKGRKKRKTIEENTVT